jgi:iron complex outermembrane recepter protein
MTYTHRSHWRLSLLMGAAFAATQAGIAHAQDKTDNTVTEVVVTATRRSEPMQKVPVAVCVLSGDQLRSANLNGLREISSQVPSFNFRQAASYKDQALFLRGLGTSSTSPGVEPSVSTVIDGVVLGRQGQASLDLLDVDHIEVLRGPQGTLFGKNASAGVLNILTKAPGETFRGYVDLGGYEGNEWRVRGGVSGAIVPGKWAANLNLMAAHYDGNVRNVHTGETLNGYDNYGARTKWVFTVSDTLRTQLTADFTHNENTSPNGVVSRTSKLAFPTNVVTSSAAFAAAVAPAEVSDTTRQVNIDFPTYALDDAYGLAFQADKQLGDYTLTSITAYRYWKNTQFQDQDKLAQAVVGLPQQHDRGDLHYDQVSQEIRLASPKGGAFDYVAGLYLFRGKDKEVYSRDVKVLTATTTTSYAGTSFFGVTNESVAIFGEGNYHFTPRLNAIVGLRATKDEVSYDFTRVSSSPVAVTGIQAPYSSKGDTEASELSSRLGLQYDLSETVMTYVTYSRGYKGPAYSLAFSTLPQDTIALKPELSNAVELGLKSRWFNKRLLANFAVFEDKVDNYQVPFFDVYNGSSVTRLINAGRVYTRGAEGDLTARMTDGLTLSGSFAYTDAKIDHFICPAGAATSCNVDSMPLTFAPKWKGVARVNYRFAVSPESDVILGTDVSYRSETQYSINQTPDTIQPAYTLWNANLTYRMRKGLEINLIGKNLGNTSYSTYLQQFGQGVTRFVPRDDQRYFGVNIHKDF